MENPASTFAETCDVTDPSLFVTAGPPAFQHHATILLPLPFTDPQEYKVPKVNPLSSKETKSCVAPLVYSVSVSYTHLRAHET